MEEKYPLKDYDNYVQARQELENVAESSNADVDKKLYTTATGALGISVAILPFLDGRIEYKAVLLVGLSLIIMSIILNILGHRSTEKATLKAVAQIDEFIKRGETYTYEKITDLNNKVNSKTITFNRCMLYALFSGIILVTFFIGYNI